MLQNRSAVHRLYLYCQPNPTEPVRTDLLHFEGTIRDGRLQLLEVFVSDGIRDIVDPPCRFLNASTAIIISVTMIILHNFLDRDRSS